MSEVHCYFPEWADRPVANGAAGESDHNSYMAGGYAEEFGYLCCADCPTVLPIVDGDPEQCALWRVQMGGLHPGYPACARPLDRTRSDGAVALMLEQRYAREDFGARPEVPFAAVWVRRERRPAAAAHAGSWWRALWILRRRMRLRS